MSEGTQLVRYDAMCSAIAAAHEIDEVKGLRDTAQRAEMYARQAQNTKAERQAHEIRLRAERKCGELLAVREKVNGGRGTPSNQHQSVVASDHPRPPTLGDLGISWQQSSDWQKLAAVPEDVFEEALDEPNPSTTGIIARHEARERGPAPAQINSDSALWLWGRLQEFERNGLLDENPHDLLAVMFEHMQKTTRELAPRVAAWLRRIGDE